MPFHTLFHLFPVVLPSFLLFAFISYLLYTVSYSYFSPPILCYVPTSFTASYSYSSLFLPVPFHLFGFSHSFLSPGLFPSSFLRFPSLILDYFLFLCSFFRPFLFFDFHFYPLALRTYSFLLIPMLFLFFFFCKFFSSFIHPFHINPYHSYIH